MEDVCLVVSLAKRARGRVSDRMVGEKSGIVRRGMRGSAVCRRMVIDDILDAGVLVRRRWRQRILLLLSRLSDLIASLCYTSGNAFAGVLSNSLIERRNGV